MNASVNLVRVLALVLLATSSVAGGVTHPHLTRVDLSMNDSVSTAAQHIRIGTPVAPQRAGGIKTRSPCPDGYRSLPPD